MSDDGPERRIKLNPHDVDHLRGGQPVYKGIEHQGENILLTLTPYSWDALREMGGDGSE